jgi:IPT/TIG domain-containing protein
MPWSSVTAQTAPPSTTAQSMTPTTRSDFSVSIPSMLAYYQLHGGSRVLGQPLSHDFQLLGRRVQIFEGGVLEQRTDAALEMMDVLGEGLPLMHAAGATFPSPDPDLLASDPPLDSPTYQTQALAAIDAGALDASAPDSWNGSPVNFTTTFRGTLACSDLLPTQPCDDRQLLAAALDVWGLPTSAPTPDPANPDLVYVRFQRGIMQFSQSTGVTQAVPIGSWFKRVLIGSDVPDDLLQDVAGSRYYGQYAPALSLGVARPSELPATSLTAAFATSDTLVTAGLPQAADPVGTPVFVSAFPTFSSTATPSASLTSIQSGAPVANPPFANGFAATPSASPTVSGTPVAIAAGAAAPATPATPLGPDPCAGDEQILFAPKKPYVGTDVLVAVTSATHHDVRTVRLTGPVKTGTVDERPGLNGWVWEWTISPTVEGWYDFTFYADGARACATSGFNALPAFGAPAAAASPTAVAFATITPIPTPTVTPTSTAVPAPSLAATGAVDPASGACAGRLLRVNGANFGATQAALNGNVLFSTPTATSVATVLSWTNNTLLVTVPSGTVGGPVQIVVTTVAGASSPLTYQVGSC